MVINAVILYNPNKKNTELTEKLCSNLFCIIYYVKKETVSFSSPYFYFLLFHRLVRTVVHQSILSNGNNQ